MAKARKESFPLEPVGENADFAPVESPAKPEPAPVVPPKLIEYDLTDVAVLHDLRKKGLLWRCKCESVACWLTVCETEDQARCNFRGKFPDAVGKLKIEQLRP